MYPSRKLNESRDYNGLTFGGHAVLSFTERIAKHYEARGSQGLTFQDGNGYVYVIGKAVAAAEACKVKLALDRVNTIIGHGTPDKADNHDARALFSCAYPGHLGFGKGSAFWATTVSPSTAAPSSPSRRSGPSATRPTAGKGSRCSSAT